MSHSFTFTVIIPTLNGGVLFKQALEALAKQTVVPDEVMVVDSSSVDDTLETARKYNARVVSIKRSDFDHGGTRSMAARLAQGDILVYLTQDAVLDDPEALAVLLSPFSDPKIAVSYGRQIPAPKASCFARHLRLFNYPGESSFRCWEDRKKYGFKTAFISNSFAAYRKDKLQEVGFFQEGLLFGEDSLALTRLLRNGYCVAYVAEARVRHSHNYSICQEFRRYFDIGVFHTVHKDVLSLFGSPHGEGKRYVVSEFKKLVHDKAFFYLPESILRNSMKFLAYKLGKRYYMLPHGVAAYCSMNRTWWKTQNK